MLHASPPVARDGTPIPRESTARGATSSFPVGLRRCRTPPPESVPNPMPNGSDQRPTRNRRPRRRSETSRLPVTEQDEVAELEAARERNDLDIRDLREMTVKELQEVGERLEIDGAPAERQRRPRRPDPPAPDRARRPRLRLRHPRHRRRGLRLHAPARPAAQPGRRLRLLEPGPPLRPPRSAIASRGAVRAPREAREVLGPAARRRVNGVDPETARRRPALRRPDADPPDRADQPRDRPQEPQPAAGQPGQPARQGPARADRQPAQGRQDDAAQEHRERHHRQLPGHPADGRAHRRAAGGSHGHAPLGQGRGHLLDLRRADREPHPRRRDGARDRQAPGRDRPRRRHPAGLDHPPGARLQPGPAAVAAGRCPAASTRSPSIRPSASSAPRGRSRRAAR